MSALTVRARAVRATRNRNAGWKITFIATGSYWSPDLVELSEQISTFLRDAKFDASLGVDYEEASEFPGLLAGGADG